MTSEEWRPVEGYGGAYEVSNLGRVRSFKVWGSWGATSEAYRILKPATHNSRKRGTNYLKVILCRNGERHQRLVHRLVLEVFVGPPPTLVHQAAHRDGDAQNNRVDNLYWATPAENAADNVRLGVSARGELQGNAKLTTADVLEIRRRVAAGEVQHRVAADYGIGQMQVSRIARRKRWAHVE